MAYRKTNTGIPSLSFSWKRALGVTQAIQKFAHQTGIPTSKAGMERKLGNMILKALFGKTLCVYPLWTNRTISILTSICKKSEQNLYSPEKWWWFCSNRFRHASHLNSEPGRNFVFMAIWITQKNAHDYTQILTQLKARGLLCSLTFQVDGDWCIGINPPKCPKLMSQPRHAISKKLSKKHKNGELLKVFCHISAIFSIKTTRKWGGFCKKRVIFVLMYIKLKISATLFWWLSLLYRAK